MGLRVKVILILTVPAVILIVAHGYLRVRQEKQQLIAEDQQSMSLTVAAMQIAVENALRDRQIQDVRRLINEMVDRQDTIDRVRLFDAAGRTTLVASALPVSDTVSLELVRRALTTGASDATYDIHKNPPVLYYVVALRGLSGHIEGAMEVVHVARGIGRRVTAAVVDVFARLSILLITLVLLIWFALQRQVLRPLAALTESIQRLGRGDHLASLTVERRDELGRVAEAFNKMSVDLERARRHLIAEQERALEFEQQLRRAETLAVAGKLTSALAHEVGTPLNIISGRAEFVAKGLSAGDPARKDLEVIVAQIDRITRTISSMLDTVRPHRPHFRPVALADVLEQIVPLLQHAAGRQQVTLATTIATDVPAALADAGQLQQVLINLILNAVDATPPDGRVELATERETRDGRVGVLLSIRDTGAGIPADVLPHVFKPFYTTKEPGRGTGLGLTICRDIVLAHEGEIRVESAVGLGTTFTIWLPGAAEPVLT